LEPSPVALSIHRMDVSDNDVIVIGAGVIGLSAIVGGGFCMRPFTTDAPVVAARLAGVGCSAVMSLGSPIGSGTGILNAHHISLVVEQATVPVILDAGVTASDAALPMGLGRDALLCASAISRAHNPVAMGDGITSPVRARRVAWGAGRIPRRAYAEASSPMSVRWQFAIPPAD
jgi:thiazole synthase